MSFLLDTNVCSAYLRGDHRVWSRFQQYGGQLWISVVTAGELFTWSKLSRTSSKAASAIDELVDLIPVIEVDVGIARRFGSLRAVGMESCQRLPDLDALIAATAIERRLTLVTHNQRDFLRIEALQLEDWQAG